jgi:hypothetical protein
MNKQQVVDYLYDIKAQLEKEGYVPTIELVIDDLETKIAEEKEAEIEAETNQGIYHSTDPITVADQMDDDSADIN